MAAQTAAKQAQTAAQQSQQQHYVANSLQDGNHVLYSAPPQIDGFEKGGAAEVISLTDTSRQPSLGSAPPQIDGCYAKTSLRSAAPHFDGHFASMEADIRNLIPDSEIVEKFLLLHNRFGHPDYSKVIAQLEVKLQTKKDKIKKEMKDYEKENGEAILFENVENNIKYLLNSLRKLNAVLKYIRTL